VARGNRARTYHVRQSLGRGRRGKRRKKEGGSEGEKGWTSFCQQTNVEIEQWVKDRELGKEGGGVGYLKKKKKTKKEEKKNGREGGVPPDLCGTTPPSEYENGRHKIRGYFRGEVIKEKKGEKNKRTLGYVRPHSL